MVGFIELLDYTNTRTSAHSHVFTSRCLVAGSNGGRSRSPRFLNYPRASTNSFPQQKLTTKRQQFSNSLTNLVIQKPSNWTQVKVLLWPTVSRPVCLGVKHPSTSQDQIFITVSFALPNDSKGLSFTTAAGPRQHSHICHLWTLAAILLQELSYLWYIVMGRTENTVPLLFTGGSVVMVVVYFVCLEVVA
jgi:hypothetical protein